MRTLNNIVEESLLDGANSIAKDMDDEIIKTFIDKFISKKTKPTIMVLKNKQVKVWGDVIIKGFEGEKFPTGFCINAMEGDLVIEKCPNLKSIEGLFAPGCGLIKGSVSICNCKSLESIEGLPGMVDGITLMNNSSLASLEGFPRYTHGNITLLKNKKKFTEKQVMNYIDSVWPGCKIIL